MTAGKGGMPPVPGTTVLDKRRHMKAHLDHVRTLLLSEPRGHFDSYGCVLVESDNPAAAFGVIFMHNEGAAALRRAPVGKQLLKARRGLHRTPFRGLGGRGRGWCWGLLWSLCVGLVPSAGLVRCFVWPFQATRRCVATQPLPWASTLWMLALSPYRQVWRRLCGFTGALTPY